MKQKLRLFAIHKTVTSLQWTDNLNPRTIWYPAIDESNWMKSAYFTIHLGKTPPAQNGCRLKSVSFFKSVGFTSSTFQIHSDFSQNQPTTITLNTGSPWTLLHMWAKSHDHEIVSAQKKCLMAVPRHFQNHLVWSRVFECSVKPYVTRPSTNCYFN
jgi:hypothetical protein